MSCRRFSSLSIHVIARFQTRTSFALRRRTRPRNIPRKSVLVNPCPIISLAVKTRLIVLFWYSAMITWVGNTTLCMDTDSASRLVSSPGETDAEWWELRLSTGLLAQILIKFDCELRHCTVSMGRPTKHLRQTVPLAAPQPFSRNQRSSRTSKGWSLFRTKIVE